MPWPLKQRGHLCRVKFIVLQKFLIVEESLHCFTVLHNNGKALENNCKALGNNGMAFWCYCVTHQTSNKISRHLLMFKPGFGGFGVNVCC